MNIIADSLSMMMESSDTEPTALTVTENGIYTAPTGVFGYSPVTVNVPTSGFTRVLLFGSEDYSSPADVNTPYQWADNLSNYDEICVVLSTQQDFSSNVIWNNFYDVTNILETGKQALLCPYYTRVATFTATDTTFTVTSASSGNEGSTYAPIIYKIYGYKY